MQHLLIVFVDQHGEQGHFVLALGPGAHKWCKAAAALALDIVTLTQAGFQQRSHTFGDDGFQIGVGRQGALLKLDAKALGDAVDG